MRLLLPFALVLIGAVTGLGVRALVRATLGRRRGGRAGVVALGAGAGAIAGIWVRDALDLNALGPELGTLVAVVAGAVGVALPVALLANPRRRR